MISCKVKYKKDTFNAYDANAIVIKANAFKSSMQVCMGEKRANAKSIIGLISIPLKVGETFTIFADGKDEEEALAMLSKAFLDLK